MLREPNVMEAMALVHSRIKHVVYLHAVADGGLGSMHHLHQISSLNHHFRVFQGYTEDVQNESSNCEIELIISAVS